MGSTEKSAKFGSNCGKDVDADDELNKSTEKQLQPTEKQPEVSDASSPSGNTTTNSRPRHDSNSSCDSARSPSTDRMKRRRTTSLSSSPLSSFFFPPPPPNASPASSSPQLSSSPSSSSSFLTFTPSTSSSSSSGGGIADPSVMSLDEVMSAVNGVTNMALAHEIALDANFKLEKFEPPQSSLEKQVRDVMHQAFWDNLREQLGQDPPVYTQAFILLQEVRDQLLEITLPHQRKLRQEISEKMDVDLIQQQAQHGVLDFKGYSGYVVALMSKLCAPVRDEAIQKLSQQTDVVDVFCGVAETLDLMKLDMANYTIQMIRPTIVKQIVEYERGKFKEFLKTQQDGLELTRSWVLKHVNLVLHKEQTSTSPGGKVSTPSTVAAPTVILTDPLALRGFCSKSLNSAYMELLQWPQDTILPETVCVDSDRVLELRDRLYQLCLLSSLMLVSLSTLSQHHHLAVGTHEQMRARLKRDLCPILDPAYTQSETLSALPNLVEQVVSSLQSYLGQHDLPALTAPTITALRSQLSELSNRDHRVTSLVTSRCLAFLAQILSNVNPRELSVPQPLVVLQEEMARICGSFLRISQHNRAVFGEYYYDMVEAALKETEQAARQPHAATTEHTVNEEQPEETVYRSPQSAQTKLETESTVEAATVDTAATAVVDTKDGGNKKEEERCVRWDSLDLD